jgi:hypothetical protein
MTLAMAAAHATGYVQLYATDTMSMTGIVHHLTSGNFGSSGGLWRQ